MDANTTLAKTAKGADEVTRRAHRLPRGLRWLLITVDGRATAGALISRFGEPAETEARLQYLIDHGFVENTRAWNPALLKQIEMHFTRFVGPVAKVLVRRAAKQTVDVGELYGKLVDTLEPTDERLKFIATQPGVLDPEPHGRMLKALRQQSRAAPLKQVSPRRDGEPARELTNDPPGWDLALLGEIERHFSRFMGSSARPIMRLAGKQTAYVDELYAMLSGMLNSPRDRLEFMATRGQLHAALPRPAVLRPRRPAGIKLPAPLNSDTAGRDRQPR